MMVQKVIGNSQIGQKKSYNMNRANHNKSISFTGYTDIVGEIPKIYNRESSRSVEPYKTSYTKQVYSFAMAKIGVYHPYSWESLPKEKKENIEVASRNGVKLYEYSKLVGEHKDFAPLRGETHLPFLENLPVESVYLGGRVNREKSLKSYLYSSGDSYKNQEMSIIHDELDKTTDELKKQELQKKYDDEASKNSSYMSSLRKEQELLEITRKEGNLIDISAQNDWKSNEPIYNFLNGIKANPDDTSWIDQKHVCTPFKTEKAVDTVLAAHGVDEATSKGLPIIHKTTLIKDLIKKDDFVDTVMKHVIKITKVV